MRTIRVLVNAMLAIVLSMGLALSAAPGEVRAAATYTVCPGGTCDFTTIQAAIDAAASGDTINVAAGTYTQTGGLTITVSGVIINLADGVVIRNNSPCFVVNADNTTIAAETFGGAKCVPTGGNNGIDVAAGITGVTINGIEIDGTDQTTGNGIHFAGAVTNIVLVNNFIHDLDGDGVYFISQPAGGIDIRGNQFMANTGLGINNPNGTSDIDATYNSWGYYYGPLVSTGDGVSLHVAYDPWTYAELYMNSSGTPWSDWVVNGQDVTYTVYGNLYNSTGADFTLNIPAGLTVKSYTAGTTFDVSTVTPGTGTLHFIGYQEGTVGPPAVPATPITGQALALFTVTLTSTTSGGYTLNLDETSDLFSMTPPSGSSNKVYATDISDGIAVVFNLPTIASTDIQGYYLTTEARNFNVTVTNTNGRTYSSSIYYDFTITDAVLADITGMSCDITGTSQAVSLSQQTGYLSGRVGPVSLDVGGDSFTCSITFSGTGEGSYPITIDVLDSGSTPAYFELASLSNTAAAYTTPTITSTDMDGPYLVGVSQDFTLTITNGATLPATTFDEVFNFPAGTTVRYSAVDYPCTGGVCTVPVTPTTGVNNLTFSVTFAAATSGSYDASLYDSGWTPDRLWAAYTQTGLIAYANYTVTGTFSLQGRVSRAGIPVTITKTAVPYGPFSANTVNLQSGNFSVINVPVDTWEVTTNQPRYLDVTAALDRTFTLTGTKVMAVLELKGGDADDDNDIDVDDASIVGGQYGSLTPTNGDINFDGKVNIFDLALVGGNFGLTSSTAYGSWNP